MRPVFDVTDERLARAIERAAEKAGMRHPLLWLNDPRAADLARSTRWPTLYDLTDDWLAADRPGPELDRIRRGEPRVRAWRSRVTRSRWRSSSSSVHRPRSPGSSRR